MKIRIKGNSIRLRLSRPEVDTFGQAGYLEEKTEFGGSQLTYALKSNKTEHMIADFKNGTVTLYIPEAFKDEWVNTERIGYEAEMPLTDGKKLHLLLEKDFKCLDGNIKDQDENYDNPLIAKH